MATYQSGRLSDQISARPGNQDGLTGTSTQDERSNTATASATNGTGIQRQELKEGQTPGNPPTINREADEQIEAMPTMASSSHSNQDRVGSSSSGGRLSSTGTSTLRPSTAGSRTHIPSVTSRAFFAPMSSQRLQAHRGQRPTSQVQYRPRVSEEFGEDKSATNRNSTGSVVTTRGPGSTYQQYDLDTMPPMSRGTDYTEYTNAGRTTTSNEYDQSAMPGRGQESLVPLQQRREPPAPLQMDGQDHDRYQTPISPREKSPRSFMSGFKRSSKASVNGTLVNGHTNGHARLPSEPSPEYDSIDEKKRQVQQQQDLGKNYEYFTGKTIFCWGGRWQNARAKPVVVITGILIIVPSVLFFVYS